MSLNVGKEVAVLERMTVRELKERYWEQRAERQHFQRLSDPQRDDERRGAQGITPFGTVRFAAEVRVLVSRWCRARGRRRKLA